MLRLAEGVILNLIIITSPFLSIILLRVTPTANRNSCRVARLVGAVTQGSVLRPQPWAMKTQLLQSCRWVRTIPPLGHLCPLKLLQPLLPPTPSCPHLLQHIPKSAPSTPRLHHPTTPPAPSSPRLHLPTPTPTPSSPRLHHTAWGNWSALFLQKWG